MDEEKAGLIFNELKDALKKAEDVFERTCEQDIWKAIKAMFGGWPKIPVSVQTDTQTWGYGVWWQSGTIYRASKFEHIEGVCLGSKSTYGRKGLSVVFTPDGLFACEQALIETNGPLGNTIPIWKAEQFEHSFDAPKKISFFEFFEGRRDKDVLLRAGEYRPELERQIATELRERESVHKYLPPRYCENWRRHRLNGKTAEELDANPDMWLR